MGVELIAMIRVDVDSNSLTLSIEAVYFLTFVVIKTLVWEVQSRWFNFYNFWHINNLFLLEIVDKAVMVKVSVVEQVDKYAIIPDEAGVD